MRHGEKTGRIGETRLIKITAGNLRNSLINIAGLKDFFPRDVYGPQNQKLGIGKPIVIKLGGSGETVRTDIPCDATTGRPRGQFRARSWARSFFERHVREVLLEFAPQRNLQAKICPTNSMSQLWIGRPEGRMYGNTL